MKNRQGLTIAALIIAIIGLSIGFAAFSNTLTISSSATVNPSDENFIVQFSKYSDSDATGELNPITPTALTSDYGENGLIPTSDKKKLQDLHATFTAPGQSVTYELYVRNTGAYVAYLKDLVFANAEHATSGETYKHCYAATKDSNNQDIAPANQATGTLVSTACEGISISVSIGTATNITPESASKSLGNQALSANGGYVSASVTISYANDAAYVDGPMEVEFGDISFTASSNSATSNEQQGGQGGQEEPQQSSSPVAATYTSYKSDIFSEIQLNNDYTALVQSSMEGTYEYNSNNSIVGIVVGGNPMEFNYANVNGNKVLFNYYYGFNVLTTNGSDGLTLTGTYSNGNETIIFNNDGTYTSSDGYETKNYDYIVIGNKIYSDRSEEDYFTTDDNFQTINLYMNGNFFRTYTQTS